MSSRVIRSHGGTKILIDCLTSLFLLEAMKPSKEIYIISPYLSNCIFLDNSFGQYTSLFPLAEGTKISFQDILNTFVWKGASVRILYDVRHEDTRAFIKTLGKGIECKKLSKNHEKGFCTENFYIEGSMNFTYSGVNFNGERITIYNDSNQIHSQMLALKRRWGEAYV